MIFILAFVLCCSASVSINSNKQVIVSKDEQVTKIMVCSSLQHQRKTIDTSVGCSTPGFIQYTIDNNYAIHPHPERIKSDHYYAEVHTTNRMYVIKVPVEQPRDNSKIFVATILSTVSLVIIAVYIYKKRTTVKEYVTSDVFELE